MRELCKHRARLKSHCSTHSFSFCTGSSHCRWVSICQLLLLSTKGYDWNSNSSRRPSTDNCLENGSRSWQVVDKATDRETKCMMRMHEISSMKYCKKKLLQVLTCTGHLMSQELVWRFTRRQRAESHKNSGLLNQNARPHFQPSSWLLETDYCIERRNVVQSYAIERDHKHLLTSGRKVALF